MICLYCNGQGWTAEPGEEGEAMQVGCSFCNGTGAINGPATEPPPHSPECEYMAKTDAKALAAELRKCVLWAECCSMRLNAKQRSEINWRDIESARAALAQWEENEMSDAPRTDAALMHVPLGEIFDRLRKLESELADEQRIRRTLASELAQTRASEAALLAALRRIADELAQAKSKGLIAARSHADASLELGKAKAAGEALATLLRQAAPWMGGTWFKDTRAALADWEKLKKWKMEDES